MNRFFAGAVWRSVGVGAFLVSSVLLVTLVFSFLGTIMCGAIVGMMAGSSRRWRWEYVLVALVFPGALLVSLYIAPSDLEFEKSLMLALVCLGSFWMTYLLTLGLTLLERPAVSVAQADHEHAGIPGAPSALPTKERAEGGEPRGNAAAAAGNSTPGEPELEEVQGTWVQEASKGGGRWCQPVLKLTREVLDLSRAEGDGPVRSRTTVAVSEHVGPFWILKMLRPPTPGATTAREAAPLPQTWVYRAAAQGLTLAAQLDEPEQATDRRIETYHRYTPS